MDHIKAMLGHDIADFESLPDIPLYMDQLLEVLEKHLGDIKRDDKQPVFTKTMVNNYVKSEVISPPVKKKYAKESLGELMMVYYLKQIFSIQDTKAILKETTSEDSVAKQYEQFTKIVHKVYDDLAMTFQGDDDYESLLMEFALEASIKKQVAEYLIDDLKAKKAGL